MKLVDVKLKHCTWSLGSAHNKHFSGGKNKVRIVVTRAKHAKKGLVRFHAVDAAKQSRFVKARV